MNRVILMGRLTRDPEVRYSRNDPDMAIANYTLAVDRRGKKQDGDQTADFISCRAFGRNAEFAEHYLKQGTKILISGHIQTGSYINRDGQKVYTTDVIIDDQEFAESKSASQGNADAPYAGSQYYNAGHKSNAHEDEFMNIPEGVEDEGLPFN